MPPKRTLSVCAPRARRARKSTGTPIYRISPDVAEHILKFCDLHALRALYAIPFFQQYWADARLLRYSLLAPDADADDWWRFAPFAARIVIDPALPSGVEGKTLRVDLSLDGAKTTSRRRIGFDKTLGKPSFTRLPVSWDIVRAFQTAFTEGICGKLTPRTASRWALFEQLLVEYKLHIAAEYEEFCRSVMREGRTHTGVVYNICLRIPRVELTSWMTRVLSEGPALIRDPSRSEEYEQLVIHPLVRRVSTALTGISPELDIYSALSADAWLEDWRHCYLKCSVLELQAVPNRREHWACELETFRELATNSRHWNYCKVRYVVGRRIRIRIAADDERLTATGDYIGGDHVEYAYGRLTSSGDPLTYLINLRTGRFDELLNPKISVI